MTCFGFNDLDLVFKVTVEQNRSILSICGFQIAAGSDEVTETTTGRASRLADKHGGKNSNTLP